MRRVIIPCFVLLCLPWVTWWARRMERRILREGRPLTGEESAAARVAGVQFPEHIRVLAVPEIPMPGFRWMQRLAARFGFDGEQTCGMTLRYGIFVRQDCAGESTLVLHECVHTGQYERLGSPAAFLRRYLTECLIEGYFQSPLECEARERAAGG